MDTNTFITRDFQEIREAFKASLGRNIEDYIKKDHQPEYILTIDFNKNLDEGVFILKYGRPGKTQRGSFESLTFKFERR